MNGQVKFVAKQGDELGEAALAVLARKGCQTELVESDDPDLEGLCVAYFSSQAPYRGRGWRGGRWSRVASVSLYPSWAACAQMHVELRRNENGEENGFEHAVVSAARECEAVLAREHKINLTPALHDKPPKKQRQRKERKGRKF